MADTSVTYTGDGVTKVYTVPFPYITTTHVKVYVNFIEMMTPSDFGWQDSANIAFVLPPGFGDTVEFKRVTPGDTRLVDFMNGAVLTEADLDLALNQVFYLAQEAKENYADLLAAERLRIGTPSGIVSTDPTEWLDSAIDTMLADATAASLQARVTDIDNNAESIIDIQSRTTDLEAYYGVTLNVNGYITGFSQFNDGISGSFTILADQFAIVEPPGTWAITTAYVLDQVVINSNSVLFKCTTAGTSGGSEPTWDETIGNTTADGTAVWTAVTDVPLYVPFLVENGVTKMQNVEIVGSLIVDGSINGVKIGASEIGNTQLANASVGADQIIANSIVASKIQAGTITAAEIAANTITASEIAGSTITGTQISGTNLAAIFADLGSITAGNITLNTSGYIKGGQTAYNTGNGYFLGYSGGNYVFSIGDGSGNKLDWDGTTLTVKGDLFVGDYAVSDTLLLSANTERTHGTLTWTTKKQFTVDRGGAVRVTWDDKHFDADYTDGGARIRVNGVVDTTYTGAHTTYASRTVDLTGLSADDVITIQIKCGQTWTDGPEPGTAYIRNARLKADVTIPADGGTVNTN